MSEMGDMKFTTAGDMMMYLPSRLESWAQNEELVASGVMTAHGQDCMDAATELRAALKLLDDYETELTECHNYMDKLRAENEKLRAERRAMQGALRAIMAHTSGAHPMSYMADLWRIARAALGEK